MLSTFFNFFLLFVVPIEASIPSALVAKVNGTLLSEKEAALILDKRTLSTHDIEKVILFQLAVEEALRQNLDKDPVTATQLKKVIYKAYLRNVTSQNSETLQVTKDELQEHYKKFPLLRISQLVLKGTPEKNAAKVSKIREAFKKGTPFRKLVLQYSEDQTALQGGDLDFRSIHNFPEKLYRVVKSLPKNTLSESLSEGENTFLFVWSQERSFTEAPETYKSFLNTQLSEQRELALLRESLRELRKNASVEVLAGKAPGNE